MIDLTKKRLSQVITRHADLLEMALGHPMTVSEYDITVYKDYAFLNILEAETIGEEEGLHEKMRAVFTHNRDRDVAKNAYLEAYAVDEVQGCIQGLVNMRSLKRKSHGMYLATQDLEVTKELPLSTKIRKGDSVMILNSSSDQVCGLYHRRHGRNHQSLVPPHSIIVPFLHRGAVNPVLFYRQNIFTRLGRNSKNIISDHHIYWIQSRLSLGLTVAIRTSDKDMTPLFRMLGKGKILRNHGSIMINGKSVTDVFFDNLGNFEVSDMYEINSALKDAADKSQDIHLAKRASEVDRTLFPGKESFGLGLRTDYTLSESIKKAMMDTYGDSLFDMDKTVDMMVPIINIIKATSFYPLWQNNTKTESALVEKIQYAIAFVFTEMKRSRTYDCRHGRNFICASDTDTLIIGQDNALTFSLNHRKHLRTHAFNFRGSTFDIDDVVVSLVDKARRRGDRENDTRGSAYRHFLSVADESNAEKLVMLCRAILVSFLVDYKMNIAIKKSAGLKVNKEIVKMLTGSYINDAISIVIDDRRLSTPYAEKGSVMIRLTEPHPELSSIVISDNPDADIVLKKQISNGTHSKDKVLTGRGSSISDSVELLYYVSSKLNLKFRSKSDVRAKIDEVGILEFVREFV